MKQKIKREFSEFRLLINSVPATVLVMFILSVFSMNLLANKSISLPFEWLALDCGIIVSWFSFLTMDMITMHFGPKAANEISVFALVINLIMCFIFFLGSKIPGVWGESYVQGCEDVINSSLNATFGGTWYVLLGSSLAFLASSFINNSVNWCIGKAFRKNRDSFFVYAFRTYVSTSIGQFSDNFIFAIFVSHIFFGWSIFQCVTCALFGMFAELLCEVVFSFFGFKICRKWKAQGIGREYFLQREIK